VSSDLIDTTEMYLKTVFELHEAGIPPMRARIAERLDHSGPTVSQTVARMERDGLLHLDEERRIHLTDKGQSIATDVMRKHRLAERHLIDQIGLPFALVHEEACRWEHVMSRDVEERIAQQVRPPYVDPYGNPIPGLVEIGIPKDAAADDGQDDTTWHVTLDRALSSDGAAQVVLSPHRRDRPDRRRTARGLRRPRDPARCPAADRSDVLRIPSPGGRTRGAADRRPHGGSARGLPGTVPLTGGRPSTPSRDLHPDAGKDPVKVCSRPLKIPCCNEVRPRSVVAMSRTSAASLPARARMPQSRIQHRYLHAARACGMPLGESS
jgi:DtxR family Mn-dependent transcriptional regulator